MKAYILPTAFILVMASGGYWAANHGTPVAGTDTVNAGIAGKTADSKHDAQTAPADAQSPSPERAISKEAQSFDLNNQADAEKFTASMRAAGVSEANIQQILSVPVPGGHSPADEEKGAEAKAYDLKNPAEKEQMADSLKANGVPEEDIQQIMRHSAPEPTPPLGDVKQGEARSYDLNNPADKEQMLAALRAEGVSDEDAQKIIINAPENAAVPGGPEPF